MKLGEKIKRIRKEKSITLSELSRKSGVALATLSRMENNKMTGTLESHQAVCRALNVSLGDLYGDIEKEDKIIENVPEKLRTEHFIHSPRARYELLITKITDKKLMPLIIKLEETGKTQKEKNKPGVEKFVYVLTGKIKATVDKKEHVLKKGDSLYFDASLEHLFENLSKTKAEAICIISPPEL